MVSIIFLGAAAIAAAAAVEPNSNYTQLIDCIKATGETNSYLLSNDEVDRVVFLSTSRNSTDGYDRVLTCIREFDAYSHFMYAYDIPGHDDNAVQYYMDAWKLAGYTQKDMSNAYDDTVLLNRLYNNIQDEEDIGDHGAVDAFNKRDSAKMNFRSQKSRRCSGGLWASCLNNFDLGSCTWWGGPVPASVGYDNMAGHEHDVAWWPHHECRSNGKNDPSQHDVGSRATFHNGNAKCENSPIASWWVRPNNSVPWPNLDSGSAGLPGNQQCN